MNKSILIISGASAGSLAAGGTAGYFYAKHRIGKAFDEQLETELESAREFYQRQNQSKIDRLIQTIDELKARLELLENPTPQDPADADISAAELQEQTKVDLEAKAKAEARRHKGGKALVDYNGISTGKVLQEPKPALDSLVNTNVFDENGDTVPSKIELFADAPRKDKPQLPPREPNGRFTPRSSRDDDDPTDNEPDPDDGDYADEPYIITANQFARGKEGYEQESGNYYVLDDTAVDVTGEVIENDVLGEGNLKLFPEEEDDESVLYIRNDKLKMDYQITLSTESLTAVTGFTDDGDPHSQYL